MSKKTPKAKPQTSTADYFAKNPAFLEMAGVFQALRKIGFPAEDIFMGALGHRLLVKLARGDKSVFFDCGPFAGEPLDFTPHYQEMTRRMNEATQPELNAIWQSSSVLRNSVAFVFAILEKGIEIPMPEALSN